MAPMRAAEAEFVFPVIGFTVDRDIRGFSNLAKLTASGPRTLKGQRHVGMELVGADLRRWSVKAVQRTGRAQSFIPWLFSSLLFAVPQSRIEFDLAPLEPITFAEAQSRACAWMEADPGSWSEFNERDEEFEGYLADVKAAKTVAELYDRLGLDTFEGE
jgi:hypothetical protein